MDFYYLHNNKKLIFKPRNVFLKTTPTDYFNSPFVLDWWGVDTNNKEQIKEFLIEAEELGANKEDINRIKKNLHIRD